MTVDNDVTYDPFPVLEMSHAYEEAVDIVGQGGVVLLSGMCGTNKTRGFLRPLIEHFGSDVDLTDLRHLELNELIAESQAVEGTYRFIDEATGLACDKEGSRQLSRFITSGAIVFSGADKTSRDLARRNTLAALTDLDRNVVDLGDYPTTELEALAAADILKSLGFDAEYIEFVEGHSVMRAPRFFSGLTAAHLEVDLNRFSDLRAVVEISALPLEKRERLSSVYRMNICKTIWNMANLRRSDDPAYEVAHALAFSGDYHTFYQSQYLYNLFGCPPITVQEIELAVEEFKNRDLIDPRIKT